MTISFLLIMGLQSLFSQQVKDVPKAFKSLSTDPTVIILKNKIKVPTDGGHLQGVQVIDQKGTDKILMSGSSSHTAFLLQADIKTQKTEQLLPLMQDPYRHAGGFQVSENYLAIGIEDNHIKTTSKVCLYNQGSNLQNVRPNYIINREGEAEQQTAGATGLLAMGDHFLLIVSNWDSRTWDFYKVDPEISEHLLLSSFAAPNDWAGYQSINLIKDEKAIYAIGFYKKGLENSADLILVSKLEKFELVMKQIETKSFNCKKGVDFNTAAGLQVDADGYLHIWGTQRDGLKRIAVNKFSE